MTSLVNWRGARCSCFAPPAGGASTHTNKTNKCLQDKWLNHHCCTLLSQSRLLWSETPSLCVRVKAFVLVIARGALSSSRWSQCAHSYRRRRRGLTARRQKALSAPFVLILDAVVVVVVVSGWVERGIALSPLGVLSRSAPRTQQVEKKGHWNHCYSPWWVE